MRLNVNNVNWVKQHRLKVRPCAAAVIWASTAVHRASVPTAMYQIPMLIFVVLLDSVKPVPPEKWSMQNVPGVNCHRGVPAKWANI